MTMWGAIVFVALAGLSVSAEPSAIFPEAARERFGSRIVSGWEAEEGQFPYQLSLRMVNPVGTVSACGGTIIHPEWGLTAAHCTATRVTMVVRAGAVNLTRPEILFETSEYYNHPLYIDALQSVVQPHDISLLKFDRAITYSDRVGPIRLQRHDDRDKNYQGLRLTASGWGRTWTNGASPENMNWVFLNGVSNTFCWQAFGGSSIIVDSTICASAYNVSSQSTCQGDSGGPLTVIDEDGRVTQVGISSFVSSSGCHTDIPAGFIRPGHYHDWYRQITGLDFDWQFEITTEAPETTTEEETETTEEETETTEAETEATTEAETEATTEAETEATTEAETEATTEAETEATTEAETEATTEAETEATTEAETEATTEAETEATTEAETEATTEAETEATTEAETEATTEAETEATTVAETEATTDAETEATTEAETEATTEAETEATTEAETATTEAETEATDATTEAEEEATTEAEEAVTEEETEATETEEATTEAEAEATTVEVDVGPDSIGFFGRFVHRFW